MSAALQTEYTPRERLLDTVLDQLEPLYIQLTNGDAAMARQAAMDAMAPYVQDEQADLNVAGQIVACGLTAMRVYKMCMQPDTTAADLAKLSRIADTLSRTEQRHRKTGLYPKAESKPAAPKPARALRVVPQPVATQQPEPAPAPGTDDPLTPEDYQEIYHAAMEGRLGDILSDSTTGSLGDRIRALSAQANPRQPPEDYVFPTTGTPNSSQ